MPKTNAGRCSLLKLQEGIVKMAYASPESKWAVSMNVVEIEEQVTALAERPFNPDEFPYAFLAAFEKNIRKSICCAQARRTSLPISFSILGADYNFCALRV